MVKKLFVNFFLFVVAIVMFSVLIVPSLLIMLVDLIIGRRRFILKEWFKSVIYFLSYFFYMLAVMIDEFGAVWLAPILNVILIDADDEVYFGMKTEEFGYLTISQVLGLAKKLGREKDAGKLLCCFLDLFDKNHCVKSLEK